MIAMWKIGGQYSKSPDRQKWEYNPNVVYGKLNLGIQPPVPLPMFNRNGNPDGQRPKISLNATTAYQNGKGRASPKEENRALRNQL